MALGNLLQKELVCCSSTASIHEVAQLMKEKDTGAVLVVDEGKPKGIVTDRDLVLRCLVQKADYDKTQAKDAMTETLETVSEEEGIFNVAEKMKKATCRRIPVVDREGKAVALLTFDDVFGLIAEEVSNLKQAIQSRKGKITSMAA